jgi:hypothetical protein
VLLFGWARRSGVDRFLGMEEASGSIPDVSTENYFIFLFAGRRPADAGLLDVLGAPMSGPGLHPIRKAADAACSYASPKRRFPKAKRPLPGHLRIR